MKIFKKKPIKFCKDCKYERGHTCFHPKAEYSSEFYLVSGVVQNFTCETMREYGCGKKAKYFEPKESI